MSMKRDLLVVRHTHVEGKTVCPVISLHTSSQLTIMFVIKNHEVVPVRTKTILDVHVSPLLMSLVVKVNHRYRTKYDSTVVKMGGD